MAPQSDSGINQGNVVQRHVNHAVRQYRNPGVDARASAGRPDKLLERMLGGANEHAAPFGLIRGDSRTAGSAVSNWNPISHPSSGNRPLRLESAWKASSAWRGLASLRGSADKTASL